MFLVQKHKMLLETNVDDESDMSACTAADRQQSMDGKPDYQQS